MNERQQAISRGGIGDGPAPEDGTIDRLSRRIADLHEYLGRAHQARADFERRGGRIPISFGGPSPKPWYRPGDPLEAFGPPPRPDGFAVGLCEAYRDRGRARLAREEYHLALADFGAALYLHPAASERELTGDLWDGRTEAWDNLCGSLPELGGEGDTPHPEAAAPPWMARSITSGHLVVGDNVILGLYPLTPEGHRAAVEQAERLAGDAGARSALVNRYLVDSDDFDILVYAFDGARLRLDFDAPVLDEDDPEPSPIGASEESE